MCTNTDPAHLQAPHIQLGFYWHDRADIDSFRSTLKWLVQDRYELHGYVDAVPAESGRLPRFASSWSPGSGLRGSRGWDIGKTLQSTDWLPVCVPLVPRNAANVSIELGYAAMGGFSLHQGDHRVVEITASGECLDLLMKGEGEEGGVLTEEDIKAAKICEEWHYEIFQAICEQLKPDYAARRWEYELEPPHGMAVAETMLDFRAMFLSDAIANTPALQLSLSRTDKWLVERFQGGVFIDPVEEVRTAGEYSDDVTVAVQQAMCELLE